LQLIPVSRSRIACWWCSSRWRSVWLSFEHEIVDALALRLEQLLIAGRAVVDAEQHFIGVVRVLLRGAPIGRSAVRQHVVQVAGAWTRAQRERLLPGWLQLAHDAVVDRFAQRQRFFDVLSVGLGRGQTEQTAARVATAHVDAQAVVAQALDDQQLGGVVGQHVDRLISVGLHRGGGERAELGRPEAIRLVGVQLLHAIALPKEDGVTDLHLLRGRLTRHERFEQR
jgi:hypothetical protein